jgi:dCMP deaminase
MEKLTAYLEIAKTLSELSPCPRAKVGAVILRPDRWSPLSSAFNGTPRKSDKKLCGGDCCERDTQNIPSGRDVQIGCHHAETNAIANAAYEGVSLKGSWLVCTAPPCLMCAKMIHHAGIEQVFFTNLMPDRWTYSDGVDYLKENGVVVQEL